MPSVLAVRVVAFDSSPATCFSQVQNPPAQRPHFALGRVQDTAAHIVTVSWSVLLVSLNAESTCAGITDTDYLYRFSGRSSSTNAPQGNRVAHMKTVDAQPAAGCGHLRVSVRQRRPQVAPE